MPLESQWEAQQAICLRAGRGFQPKATYSTPGLERHSEALRAVRCSGYGRISHWFRPESSLWSVPGVYGPVDRAPMNDDQHLAARRKRSARRRCDKLGAHFEVTEKL